MNSPIVISTGEKQYKNVEIDEVGFKVRNFGAGEQLRMSQIQKQLKRLDVGEKSEENQDSLVDLSIEAFEIVKNLFEDGKNGEEVEKLFNRLEADQILSIITQVFGTKVESNESASS